MKYLIYLDNNRQRGKLAVKNSEDAVKFFISGNLDSYSHTILLSDLFNNEIGRLYQEHTNIFNSYRLDIIGRDLLIIKKLNIYYLNLLYISKINYFIKGNIKSGNYYFISGIKKVATVKTLVTPEGTTLSCNISNPNDIPIILLTSILFTRWNSLHINLPELNTKSQSLNSSLS